MSSDNIEQKVDESLNIARENRKILKKLLSYRRWEAVFAVTKFVLFAIVAFGLYYYLQPYLDQVLKIYTDINGLVGGFSGLK
ncbi:MAG: hypothetical protein QG609_617 [Patescibacteria group bacterium]|jgi:predicted MFS family arabinose efflux permease|nr:hypothetical protein [Patescibacteria group bacterium]